MAIMEGGEYQYLNVKYEKYEFTLEVIAEDNQNSWLTSSNMIH